MLELLLRGYLVYLSFVQPVIYGAQLCHAAAPDPLQVTNVTLTLIFAWLLEVADVLFISSFIAMRWLYLCGRIILALYFAHPRFLGAVQVYRRVFASLVDVYSPVIDSIVVRHVQTIGDSGLIQYGTQMCTGMLRGLAALAAMAKALLEASATTTVPAAALPRRMSQERDDRGIARADSPLPLRSSPPTRSVGHATPQQPPSLYYDESETEERGRPARGLVNYSLEAEAVTEADLWYDITSEELARRPRVAAREPQTVVNRAHRAHDPSDPFDY